MASRNVCFKELNGNNFGSKWMKEKGVKEEIFSKVEKMAWKEDLKIWFTASFCIVLTKT